MSKDIALTFIFASLPVLYVSTFLHELGHALMALRSGFIVSSFGLGTARPLWVWDWRGTKVYLCRQRSRLGLTWLLNPQIYPSRQQIQ